MKSSLVVVATFLFGCIVVSSRTCNYPGFLLGFIYDPYQTTEAGAPCRNPPIMMRPDECCDFPKMGNEKEVVEACMVQHGAHVARLMADKNGSSYRGSVRNRRTLRENSFNFLNSHSALLSVSSMPLVTLIWINWVKRN